MIATLTYTLPDERSDFALASKAHELNRVIRDLDDFLRSALKYEDVPKKEAVALQTVRTKLHELCREHSVDGDEFQ